MSFKRARTPSNTSESSPHTTSKVSRASTSPLLITDNNVAPTTHPLLLCSLPPTCNPPHHVPTPLENSKELEAHYAKYHAHVCEQPGCGCVFPDGRLLELHQTECHDPIAAVRKDRGEKIFACHLISCPRLFLTPKARRMHLIETHAYPKQFFFAVTNKGIGGLLKRWGDGASMIRGQWKPREGKEERVDVQDEADKGEGKISSDVMEEDTLSVKESTTSAEAMHTEPRRTRSLQDFTMTEGGGEERRPAETDAEEAVDRLAQSMNSLSLVPPSIRFGRGGKNGGFVHHRARSPHPPINNSEGRGQSAATPLLGRGGVLAHVSGRGRGIGFERGRGRGPYSNVNMNRRVGDEVIVRGIRGRGRGRGRGRVTIV